MIKLYYPVKPWWVTQKFGENKVSFYKQLGMKGHNGIDVGLANGTPVRAAHDGVVTFTGEDGSAGQGVVIRTTAPDENGVYWKSIYWHLLPKSFKVRSGQTVKTGDLLALSDNTGLSTGPHLHFGLKPMKKGENNWEWINLKQKEGYFGAVDPQPYFTEVYAEDLKGLWSKLLTLLLKLKK